MKVTLFVITPVEVFIHFIGVNLIINSIWQLKCQASPHYQNCEGLKRTPLVDVCYSSGVLIVAVHQPERRKLKEGH